MSAVAMPRSRLALAAVAALILAAAAAPQPAHGAAQVISASAQRLDLEINKGRLVRLDRPAASVFVADPAVADIQVKSPTLVYVLGKAAGETTLFAVGDRDEILLNASITVRHDVARLQQALRELVPDTAVDVSTVDDSLVLSGKVFSASEGDDVRRLAARFVPDKAQLINNMQVDAPNQVNIRVRVAEMSRATTKAFGFNWQSVFGSGNFLLGLATGNPIFAAGTVLGAPGVKSFLTQANGTNSAFASYQSGSNDLNVLIDALDREGLVTVLAEPNLTAVSGETASFLAGGEFPIPVPGQNSSTTIEFKKFGVSLAFVATVGPRNRISLRVKPEVSQLSSAGAITLNSITIPALTTRRAETTVELASGQSFAVAGLIQNNVTHDLNKFPWLGDVPVLGQLFRSDRFQRNESELVIIVTPYIVRPISSKRLAAPTDGFVSPNDAERVAAGATYRPQAVTHATAPAARNGSALVGPVGFEIE